MSTKETTQDVETAPTNTTLKKGFLTPTQLRKYVKDAQQNKQEAIDALYRAFIPMIRSMLKETHAPDILSEDAENIAWEEFFKFIHKYEGDKYSVLPGLLRSHVKYRLIDKMTSYHTQDIHQTIYTPEIIENTLVDNDYKLENSELSIDIGKALEKLTPNQKQILYATTFQDMSVKNYAQRHHCSFQSVYKSKVKALQKLREFLV